MTDHATVRGTIAFVATVEFIKALDRAAALEGTTRSHFSRKLLAAYLREVGLLPADSPMTPKAGRHRAQTQ